jgi:hypothetical protein
MSGLTGSAITNTQVTIIPALPANCSLHLNPGWNLVSFYCLGLFTDRSAVLSSIDGQYTKIFSYNPYDTSDPWKSYNPNLPAGIVQQLNNMDRMSGYWIYIPTGADLTYEGVNKTSSTITMKTGWNLIGYPSITTRNINNTLNNISFTIIQRYNTTSDTWLVYINGSSNNTLNTLDTYVGYWINVTSDQSLIIYNP